MDGAPTRSLLSSPRHPCAAQGTLGDASHQHKQVRGVCACCRWRSGTVRRENRVRQVFHRSQRARGLVTWHGRQGPADLVRARVTRSRVGSLEWLVQGELSHAWSKPKLDARPALRARPDSTACGIRSPSRRCWSRHRDVGRCPLDGGSALSPRQSCERDQARGQKRSSYHSTFPANTRLQRWPTRSSYRSERRGRLRPRDPLSRKLVAWFVFLLAGQRS